jgi:hypothetical protein
MRTLGLLAGACGIAAFALATGATALPLGKTNLGDVADGGLLQQIHGCHSDWREDRFGLHRHSRDCRRIDAEGPRGGPPRGPRRDCYYVGPVRVCP